MTFFDILGYLYIIFALDIYIILLLNSYGIAIKNMKIKVFESNPYINNISTVKVTIRDIPLHVKNTNVLKHSKSIDGLKMKSNAMYGQERYPSGRFSKCLNGKRFFMQRGQLTPL